MLSVHDDTIHMHGTDNQLDTFDIQHALDHFSDSDDDTEPPPPHISFTSYLLFKVLFGFGVGYIFITSFR